jgi:hypothetical protein
MIIFLPCRTSERWGSDGPINCVTCASQIDE